jgi:chromosome segregation ATPase
MVKILGDEQAEDDKHKEYCDAELEKSADDKAAATNKAASEDATITEVTDAIANIASDVATLTEGIKALDKSVATATNGRKAEHAEFSETQSLNDAAAQLLEKAKQRLYKFYNPTLYKAPPKRELSMEDSMYAKAGRDEFVSPALVQIRSHRVALPQAPETFSGIQQPKTEKSTGVIALMEMMQKDLASDMKDAEADEQMAQKEYEELMTDSAASRAQSAKSITDKEASKAQLETKLQETKESKALTTESLEDIALTVNHLHTSCDFILENYDARAQARTNEGESLKNGKAVLAGANLGF